MSATLEQTEAARPVSLEGTPKGANFGAFYVPNFELRLKPADSERKGDPLPPTVVRDVMQVTYSDSVNEIDSFEFTVNNWDAKTQSFKYAGMEIRKKGERERAPFDGLFDPVKEIELWMGYGGERRLMITGQITTLEPNFPASGGPTLTVRGLNVLHKLRRKQYTEYWPKNGAEVRDSDIAREIGKAVDDGKKRFPLTIVINEGARDSEPREHHVFQKNQYDIVFLLNRARSHGYVVVVVEPEDGSKEKCLYFGPSEGLKKGLPREQAVTYLLEWGKSLIQFKPTLTTARQIGSVTVRGWDRRKKEVFEGRAEWKELKINRDLGDIAKEFDEREEIVTDQPVYDKAEANKLAQTILKNQLKDLVKASGATIGLPDLRAGRNILIAGVGDRYGGKYYVTETTHTINDSGYQTTFNARREEEGEAAIA
jgi:uncharacterized protein